MWRVDPEPGQTLEDAKKLVKIARSEGVVCPCCGQFAKLYRRKINSGMAYSLILVHRYFLRPDAEEWLHVPTHLIQEHKTFDGDFAKLRYWGLVEEKHDVREDGSERVGFYKITDLGKQFVRGEMEVPRYILLYNGALEGFSKEWTTIHEALGDKFNYDELMAA